MSKVRTSPNVVALNEVKGAQQLIAKVANSMPRIENVIYTAKSGKDCPAVRIEKTAYQAIPEVIKLRLRQYAFFRFMNVEGGGIWLLKSGVTSETVESIIRENAPETALETAALVQVAKNKEERAAKPKGGNSGTANALAAIQAQLAEQSKINAALMAKLGLV